MIDLGRLIVQHLPRFTYYPYAIEAELFGKWHLGNYIRRSHSFLLVPLMTVAILGPSWAMCYFPKLSNTVHSRAQGQVQFTFEEIARAIRFVLDLGSIPIYGDDVVAHPHNHTTMYFSNRLQEAVLEGLLTHAQPLYFGLQQWIQRGFDTERHQHARDTGAATHLGGTTRPPAPSAPPPPPPPPQTTAAVPDPYASWMQPLEAYPHTAWTPPSQTNLSKSMQSKATRETRPLQHRTSTRTSLALA